MKKIIILLLVLPILFISGCSSNTETVSVSLNTVAYKDFSEMKPVERMEQLSDIKSEIPYDDFSIIFSKLIESLKEEDNFVISPLSLYLGLASIYEIGDENVKKEIKDFMNISDDMISETNNLMNYLKNSISDFSVNNSIWIDKNLSIKQESLSNLTDKFLTEVYHTEFHDNNEKACLDINNYMKENTNNLIKPDYKFDELTLFALINTLYLKANWKEELKTENLDFNGSNSTYKAEYLIGTLQEGKIGENECSRFFYINAKGAKLTIFIPKDNYSLNDIMTANNINEINNYKYTTREDNTRYFSSLIFPSFEINKSLSMTDYFVKNGLLTSTMELFKSNICKQSIKLSKMQHEATIKVNSFGIEGSAVTIAEFGETSAAPIEVYDQLLINKNFGFILSYDNIILFAGQIVDLND